MNTLVVRFGVGRVTAFDKLGSGEVPVLTSHRRVPAGVLPSMSVLPGVPFMGSKISCVFWDFVPAPVTVSVTDDP
jgi:hypothetical protein